MRKMKDSGISWIGEIPEDWSIEKFKTLFSFGRGLPITKDNLIDYGIPVISYGQIHSKENNGVHILPSLLRYVSPDFLNSNPQSLVSFGDIIFADTSEDYEGIGNNIFIDYQKQIFAGYHTIIVRTNTKYNYFAYLFKTDNWRSQLRSIASGIKVYSITQKMLKDIEIIVPPQIEQSRIQQYLDTKCSKIDSIITKIRTLIDKLKEYKQSVITQAVTKGLDPDVPMKDSGVPWIGEIPEQWGILKIKNIASVRSEQHHPDEEVLSVYRDYGVIIKSSRDDNFNRTSENTDIYKLVCEGDLVINKMKTWQGSLGISKYRGIVSPAYYIFRIFSDNIHNLYLHFLLRSIIYLPVYMRISSGIRINQWDLDLDEFKNLEIITPQLSEQISIARYLDNKCAEIDSKIEKQESVIERLESYKKSIIYEFVTGKREIPQ